MNRTRLLVVAVIVVLVGAFLALDGQRYLTLEQLRAQQEVAQRTFLSHPWQTALGYLLAYVAVTGLSLPGAAVLTLFGGAVFGLLWGTVIVSFASSIGATLAFLVSRFVLRDWVQGRFGDKLKPVNDGVAREGAFYL
ncbi:MAG: TVP38/TMEM64 family protein, partial [Burkholderiales bacterium]